MPETAPTGSYSRLTPGDAGFVEAVSGGLFNSLRVDGEPDAVVVPRTEADVVAIVRDAARTATKVAIRSGGHSWVASSVREGSILVDLAAFDAIDVDVEARTARVGPAVRGQRLSKELVAHGLAFPVGHCGNPALGGFLLGGGLGVNWGHWLPSCFSIRSMRVVLSSGEVVVASETSNPELFWLARGSGPGFPGIVTEFELDLQPLPAAIRLSSWMFALADLAAVTSWVTRVSAALPSNVEVSLVVAGPQRPGASADSEPFIVGVVATAFTADEAEAAEALHAFATDRGPGVSPLEYLDAVPVAFDTVHEAVDATYPEGYRYLADTFWSPLDLGAALEPLAELITRAPSGVSYILSGMPKNGDGANLVPKGVAAYGMHDKTLVVPYVIWADESDDAANLAWLNELRAVLEPVSSGHFMSEADLRHDASRVSRSFAGDDGERVLRLIRQFDPDSLFCGFPRPAGVAEPTP
ncbi:FAD-binding oxidoreductase [Subtercola lobariae]|uniref:Oxidoreductase n=1 Tax=Subtercola lobariae TaxID=1588641 RepID=A0A917EXK0_9MICO|nr:FAD-binding oxidoreductase [Subtercola lobariae]GGF27006.1 oxidoreductase [Subtercola lobariae]